MKEKSWVDLMNGKFNKKEYLANSSTVTLLDIFHVGKKRKIRRVIGDTEYGIYKMLYAHKIPKSKRKK